MAFVSIRSGILGAGASQVTVSTTAVAAVVGARVGARYFAATAAVASPARPDGNYIATSSVPTYHFQASLPRLPIPSLDDSCQRYLDAVEPLLEGQSEEARLALLDVVESFRNGEGIALQESLVAQDKANKHTSFISDYWFDMYLKDRRSIVLNSNPFIGFKQEENGAKNDPRVRAPNLLYSAGRWYSALRDEVLPPEIFAMKPHLSDSDWWRTTAKLLPSPLRWAFGAATSAFALDMSQYGDLFGTTRIPGQGVDTLLKTPESRHVVALRGGKIFSFDLLDAAGNVVPLADLSAAVDEILSHPGALPVGEADGADSDVAVLTSLERDAWAAAREHLAADPVNAASLSTVDTALFALCLDDAAPKDEEELSHQMLHNGGADRWFDKSFNLIVSGNGLSAIHFEHAWGDGVAVLRFFNDVYADSTANGVSSVPEGGSAAVTPLTFNVDDQTRSAIREARAEMDQATGALEVKALRYEGFTKGEAKKHRVSPDAVAQMAFQLAYRRMTGGVAATYESASTAGFRRGRTETIRSCTAETSAFAKTFLDEGSSVADKLAALDLASARHSELVTNAAKGQGFDRHLFALRKIAAEDAGEVPAIFTDAHYAKLNHVILSTSTLSAPGVLLGGFAPVVADGFGLGYAITDEYFGCQVSSYQEGKSAELVAAIEASISDIADLVRQKKPKE